MKQQNDIVKKLEDRILKLASEKAILVRKSKCMEETNKKSAPLTNSKSTCDK